MLKTNVMTRVRATAGLLAVVIAAAALATPVLANVVAITARASTVCRIDFSGSAPATLPAGESALGQMTELCNSAAGYRLVVRHPRELDDSYIIVDGQRIALTASAEETVIIDSDLPGFRQRSIAISLAKNLDWAGLSFEARPKGMIF